MKDFREKTVSGVGWNAVGQAGRQAAVLLTTVILARLLTPRDFGLFATVIIFSNFAFILSEQGFMLAVVQRKEVSEEHLCSTFWLNILVGASLSAIFYACAPLAARVYGEPALAPLMRVMASLFSIFPLGMVHRAVLTRRLAFRAIAIAEIVAAWIGGAIGVLLAWRGFGVYSIALQLVFEFAACAAALWCLCGWRPGLVFRWRAVGELAGMSTHVFLSNVADYWVRNIDNLLIGLYLGAYPLGLYSRAYAIMLFPITRISWVFSRVMVRAFSMIQDDPGRVRAVFLRMTRAVALVTFPMMFGVSACAPDFVACVFGGQWGEMAPVLRLLACVGMLQSVTALVNSVFLSRGRADLNLKVSFPCQLLQAAGIVVGLNWGILGVAIGYSLTSLLVAPIHTGVGTRLIGSGSREFFSNLKEIFACSVMMAAGVAVLGALLPQGMSSPARLGLQMLLGAAFYSGLLHAFGVEGYRDFKDIVRERLQGLRSGAA